MRDYLEESGGATDYLFNDESPDDSDNEESREQSTQETDKALRGYDKQAVAICDIRQGKVERFDCAQAVVNQARTWLENDCQPYKY